MTRESLPLQLLSWKRPPLTISHAAFQKLFMHTYVYIKLFYFNCYHLEGVVSKADFN